MLRPRDIAPGISMFPARTPTLAPATHTNSYALGRREVVLVEPATPYEDERREWISWVRAIEAEGRAVRGIIVTHHHVDHASGASFFARALKLPLFAHPNTIRLMRNLDGLDVRPLRDGERLDTHFVADHCPWIALHTPGHAPGHICLHDPVGRTLIAGDMVANGSTILIPPDDGGDMGEYIEQLRRLDALDTTMVLPAHGEPLDAPHSVFSYYIAHRLEREVKVLAAYRDEGKRLGRTPSLDELVPIAYADTPMQLWPIARLSLEAHVAKLKRERIL